MTSAISLKRYSAVFYLLTTLLITLFLFFIDEGNYNFDNLFQPGNLLALSIYFVGIYVAQLLAFKFLEKRTSPLRAFTSGIFLGIPGGILVMVTFFLLIRWVMMG